MNRVSKNTALLVAVALLLGLTAAPLAANGAHGPQYASNCTPISGPKVHDKPMNKSLKGSERPICSRR